MRLPARTSVRSAALVAAGLLVLAPVSAAPATAAEADGASLSGPGRPSTSGSTPSDGGTDEPRSEFLDEVEDQVDRTESQRLSRALAESQERLIEVEAQLREAEDRLREAEDEHRTAETAASRAQAEHDRAVEETSSSRDAVTQAENDIGALARQMYQGGSASQMSSAMTARSARELTDKVSGVQAVLRATGDQVDRLDYASNVLALKQDDALALADAAEQARVDAASALSRADEAAAAVASTRSDVETRIAEQETALAAAEQAEDQELRELAAQAQASAEDRAEAAAAADRAVVAERQAVADRAGAQRGSDGSPGAPDATDDTTSTPDLQPGARLVMPATGQRTSPFGMRTHPITGVHKLHTGLDFGVGDGVVYAAGDGTVVEAGYDGAYGNKVVVSHGRVNGRELTTMYAHQSGLSVSPGQQVTAGQQIGRIGSTGYSTGPHLHLEVRLDGQPVNPADWL